MKALLLICIRQIQGVKAATELLIACVPHQKMPVPQHSTPLFMTISVTFANETKLSSAFFFSLFFF